MLHRRRLLLNVLFVCIGNQGRSVMAERLFRAAAPQHRARSAGSQPGPAVHPGVLEALAEVGIDASDHVPQQLTDELIAWADLVVETCDGACSTVADVHWEFRDPAGLPVEEVRPIRDEIGRRVSELA